ncbi:putative quinol monooxygenase [Amycolatopsis sp. NPDC049252]|uniref:putative quinol monooxygenase n=1 Tax=Amycolatopsis sp. NPDC049252 TaxID=3363933 RepID=UPI003714E18A
MTEAPTVGLLVTMEAKPGRESDVEKFLESGRALVDEEPATTAWFAFRLGDTTFGIYDVFPDDAGREAHLNGKVAEALMAQAPDLFAGTPVIQRVDILASKLP